MKVPDRTETIRKFRESGGKIGAVFPIHYPRALLFAHRFLPVEVWGPPRVDKSRGAAHLQPYVCSLVRNALSFALSPQIKDVDVLIVPHGCDSLQGLGSILLDFAKVEKPVVPLYIPKGSRAEDVRFFAEELESLGEKLSHITGESPDPGKVMECIEAEERACEMALRLFEKRKNLPLSNEEFYRIARAREYLTSEEFIRLAEETLELEGTSPGGIPIVISGVVPEPSELLSRLDQLGAIIVGDDTACCGRRLYPPGKSSDPFIRMAESIINGPPDSMRGATVEERAKRIAGLVKDTGAKGVLFHLTKFCEPELFYLPTLRERLKQNGIPSIAVEVDIGDPLSDQTVSRIAAFLEMLK